MRKIHHGFIAIAILGGPASIILAHQTLTEILTPGETNPSDVAAIVQQAYSKCSEAPRPIRPSLCDEYIRSFDQCAARNHNCDPQSVYEVLLKFGFTLSDRSHGSSPEPL